MSTGLAVTFLRGFVSIEGKEEFPALAVRCEAQSFADFILSQPWWAPFVDDEGHFLLATEGGTWDNMGDEMFVLPESCSFVKRGDILWNLIIEFVDKGETKSLMYMVLGDKVQEAVPNNDQRTWPHWWLNRVDEMAH